MYYPIYQTDLYGFIGENYGIIQVKQFPTFVFIRVSCEEIESEMNLLYFIIQVSLFF